MWIYLLRDVIQHVTVKDVVDTINKLKLTPRRAVILRLRLGLEDGEMWTLKQVAERFSITRERVRAMERKAIDELRMIARTKSQSDE